MPSKVTDPTHYEHTHAANTSLAAPTTTVKSATHAYMHSSTLGRTAHLAPTPVARWTSQELQVLNPGKVHAASPPQHQFQPQFPATVFLLQSLLA
jgi:hypothetical protein